MKFRTILKRGREYTRFCGRLQFFLFSFVVFAHAEEMVWIPGATFTMGSDIHYSEERPAHEVTVRGFWIDVTEVTNAQFREFVDATGYRTVAERPLDPKEFPELDPARLKAGSLVFSAPKKIASADFREWWTFVAGASWRDPLGDGAGLAGKEQLPVVHIAYEDARAFAKWKGRTLPTEAEWERAASVAHGVPDPKSANTWQGEFPIQNTGEDGFRGVAPVGSFPANAFGVSDLIGNVWEWTSDWYRPEHDGEIQENPKGPASCHPAPHQRENAQVRVIKGGSFLCAPNYCRRYRASARQGQEVRSSTNHIGFRTVLRIDA